MEPLLVAEPIRAQRRARLGALPDVGPDIEQLMMPFLSIHARTDILPSRDWSGSTLGFGVDATAVCMVTEAFLSRIYANIASERVRRALTEKTGETSRHRPPDPECTCGFYAVPDGQLLYDSCYGGTCTLDVELTGRVIDQEAPEYGTAWRGERQRVVAVRVDRWCYRCDRIADVLASTAYAVAPICERCIAPPQRLVGVDDVAEALGVDVTWGPIDAPAKNRSNRSARAYAAAMRAVREEYRQRFDQLYAEERRLHGLQPVAAAATTEQDLVSAPGGA